MYELINREQVVNELANMMLDFYLGEDRRLTEVFLIHDQESKTAHLETYSQFDCNVWDDDDERHGAPVIYEYEGFKGDSYFDNFTDWDFAEFLDMDYDAFEQEVLNYLVGEGRLDEEDKADYEINFDDANDYVMSDDELRDKLYKEIRCSLFENAHDESEKIISRWECGEFDSDEEK